MASASIGEFFVKLGFQTDTKPLKNFESSMKNLRKNVVSIGLATVGAAAGLNKVLQGTIATNRAYNEFNQRTGLSIEKLQEFENGALRLSESLSSDKIQSSVTNLQKNLTNLRLGKGDLTPFQQLRINPLQDAFGVIEQARESIQGLDDATATNLLEKIGLNDFLPVLRAGREEFERLAKGIFLTGEQREAITKLNLSFKNIIITMKQLKDQAVAKLAPQLTTIVEDFFKWINNNSTKIISAIASITNVFVNFLKAVGNSISLITKFIDKITGTQQGLKIFSLALLGIALSFAPVIAGISAVVALLDDIKVWMEGGDSLFGGLYDVLQKFPSLIAVFGGLAVLPFLAKMVAGVGALSVSMAGLLKSAKLLKTLGIGAVLLGTDYLVDKHFTDEEGKKTDTGNLLNAASKGAGAGAVAGSFLPVVGTAGGAALGALGGLVFEVIRKAMEAESATTNNNKNTNNTYNVSMQVATNNPKELTDGFLDQLKRADVNY